MSGHYSRPSPPISAPSLSRPLCIGLCAPGPLSRSDCLQGSLPPSSAQLRFCLPTCLVGMNALHPLTPVFSALCPGYLCPYLVSIGPVSPVWAGSLLDPASDPPETQPFTCMWALTAQRCVSGLPGQPEVQQLLVPHDLRDWSQGRRQNRKDMTGPDHPQMMGLWVLFPKLFRPPCATRLPGGLLI